MTKHRIYLIVYFTSAQFSLCWRKFIKDFGRDFLRSRNRVVVHALIIGFWLKKMFCRNNFLKFWFFPINILNRSINLRWFINFENWCIINTIIDENDKTVSSFEQLKKYKDEHIYPQCLLHLQFWNHKCVIQYTCQTMLCIKCVFSSIGE